MESREINSDIDTRDKRNGMLCSSEQLLMGRILDIKSSYKGDNSLQNILKIKCPRLAKNAFATQHLLHRSIIYTFIYYHTMNENGCISELIPTEQVTFFLLVTHFWYFFHPCTWGPKGLLQTADSIFIKFVSCECKKASQKFEMHWTNAAILRTMRYGWR
jgi:hypothetical protein